MIFFPYRAQIKLTKVPIVTIAISLVCLVIYYEQYHNERAIEEHASEFCTGKVADKINRIIERYLKDEHYDYYYCKRALLDIYTGLQPEESLDELTRTILKHNGQPWDEAFREHYRLVRERVGHECGAPTVAPQMEGGSQGGASRWRTISPVRLGRRGGRRLGRRGAPFFSTTRRPPH